MTPIFLQPIEIGKWLLTKNHTVIQTLKGNYPSGGTCLTVTGDLHSALLAAKEFSKEEEK